MRGAAAAACFAFACACAASPVARADASGPSDVEEAKKHYARGVALYEQGADEAALAALERAYQLAPNWKVLYELGVVEMALHDFTAALKYFRQYLDEGGDAVKGARKKEVVDYVAQLEQQIATIDLATDPGASVKLDDVDVGTAPLAKPLVVNPGHHKIAVSKDGRAAEPYTIIVSGGDHPRVEIALPAPTPPVTPPPASESPPPAPAPPPPPALETHEAPPPPSRADPFPPWLGWTVTGALAAGAVVTGLEALSANSSLTNAKGAPSTPEALSSLSSRAHGFALACDVTTGLAVVAAGTTLYFALRPQRPATAPATPAASVGVGVGVARIVVQARF